MKLFRCKEPLLLSIPFWVLPAATDAVAAGASSISAGHPKARANGVYQSRSVRNLGRGRFTSIDSLRLLVIRVSFTDRDFRTDEDQPHDSLFYANELRHLHEYYHGASRGGFDLVWEMAPGVWRLSRDEKYYGEDGYWDERVVEMLMEVAPAADSVVDYSRFDAFALLHAGAGQETDFLGNSPEQLWSGFIDPEEMTQILADTLGTPGIPTGDTLGGDPFYVDNLMILPEEASQDGQVFGSLGIYAYQVGIRLGMLPLFDATPPGFPDSQGIGSFGLMGYGLYNALGFVPAFPCAFHRYLMGWIEPVEVAEDGTVRLRDINSAHQVDTALAIVRISPAEYFLMANRVHDTDFDGRFDFIDLNGNGVPENEDTLLGAEFDFFLTATTNPERAVENPVDAGAGQAALTGSGLMIWHIDEALIIRALEDGRNPLDDPALRGVDLEEADGVQDLDRSTGTYGFGSYLDSFREGNNDRFGVDTNPSSANNGGVGTGIEVLNISAADSLMHCDVRFTLPVKPLSTRFPGDTGALHPIPVDTDGDGGEELVITADTGFVYVATHSGDEGWSGRIDTLFYAPGAVWTAPPIFEDMDRDGTMDVFATGLNCELYAFSSSGAPYVIDTDASPGSLTLRGEIVSSPILVEADGDEPPEVLVLTSSRDSTVGYLVECAAALIPYEYRTIGDGVLEVSLTAGRLCSHPARGVLGGDGGRSDGFFFASATSGKGMQLHYVPLTAGGLPVGSIDPVTRSLSSARPPGYLLTPAAGDINEDGSDEMVIAIPATGLVYYEPLGRTHTYALRGTNPSSPALDDIDGDGVMETALRDETSVYLLTGFGIARENWPVEIETSVRRIESSLPPAPPVIGNVSGIGEVERMLLLFRLGGDIHAFDVSGEPIPDWTLPATGDAASSLALLSGTDSAAFIFAVAAPDVIVREEGTTARYGSRFSSLVRYAPPGWSMSKSRGWRFYRRDDGGTSRQLPSGLRLPEQRFIEEETFICYPNPARGDHVTVRVVLSAPCNVTVRVLNLEGEGVFESKRVHDWDTGTRVPFEERISTVEIASGVYACLIEIDGGGWSWRGARKFAVVH